MIQKFYGLTVLDLAQTYLQLPLDEASKKYITINTQKGLYQYTWLPFGVASAPSIFQRTMENLLWGMPKVCVYLDDILITGANWGRTFEQLCDVLSRLEQAGMHLRKDKCAFLLPQVEHLEHQISHPTWEKVRAIVEAPDPSVEILSGHAKLLQQVFTKFVNCFGSILQLVAQKLCLAVGSSTTNHVWQSQETISLFPCTCTLQSR